MNILHLDSSPRADSHSRKLSAAIVAKILAEYPEANVTRRDLGRDPIPHPTADYAEVLSSPAKLFAGAESEAVRQSERLIVELEAADVVVLGTPMNNFTVPSVLKSWIDQILRIGRSIAATPEGKKVGALKDRPVLIAVASGGVHSGEKANQPDFLTPYLTAALGCVGLKTLRFYPLQGTAFQDEARSEAMRTSLLDTVDVSMLRYAG
jgi:FMN-dependent NADH-azoreductase